MRRQKLLELGMKGTDFDIKVPAGTSISNIEQAIGLFIIDCAKYRSIKSSQMVEEIRHWVTQLEENL